MKDKIEKRDKAIDILKGIGILFVILGHMNQVIPINLLIYIYSFHMPLFFYISGYLYKEKYQEMSFKDYFKKRLNQLLYPYLTFSIINFVWILIKNHSIQILAKCFISLLYSNYIFETNYIGAVWFLLCLFVVEIMYYIIQKYFKKYEQVMICIGLLLGVLLNQIINIKYFRLPFWSDIALFALVFYHVGYIVKRRKNKIKINLIGKLVFLTIFIIINIVVIIYNYNYCYTEKFLGKTDMLYLHFGNYVYFFISAFAGIFSWQIISNIINSNIILELFGKNTLTIMGIHIIILQIVMKFSNLILNYNIYLQIVVNFGIIAITSLACSFIIKRFLPRLISIKD